MRMNAKRFIGLIAFVAMALGLTGCGQKPSSVNPSVKNSLPTEQSPAVPIAENTSTKKASKVTQSDPDLLDKVSKLIMTVLEPLPDFVKKPTFEIVEMDQINAYAKAEIEGKGPDVKVQPKVVVFTGLMDRVIRSNDDPEGAEDRLAFVLSH